MSETKKLTAFDKIRNALDAERMGPSLVEMIRELDLDTIRAAGEALMEAADALDGAADEIDAIADAEGRDERAAARDEALGSLEDAVGALNSLPGEDDSLLLLAMEVGL